MRSRSLSLVAAGVCAAVTLLLSGACSSFSEEGATADAGLESGADGAADDAAEIPVPDGSPKHDGAAKGARVLASGFADLTSIAATDLAAFVTARAAGTITKIPLDGSGIPVELYKAAPLTSPSNVTVFADGIFWADTGNGLLGRMDGQGGGRSELTVANSVKPVAVAAGKIGPAVRVVVAGTDAAGGTVLQYAPDLAFVSEVSGTYMAPFDVAVTDASVWWTEPSTGTIWQGTLDQQAASARVTGEPGCEAIAADAAGVYWTRRGDGLVRMRPAGEPTTSTLAQNQTAPFSIASDASNVYWLTGDGALRRSDRQPSEVPPQTIAKGFAASFTEPHIRGIALTSKYVVWITSDGQVLRADK